jgi:hypothetical protein
MLNLGLIWVDYVYLGEQLVEVWANGQKCPHIPPRKEKARSITRQVRARARRFEINPYCPKSAPKSRDRLSKAPSTQL